MTQPNFGSQPPGIGANLGAALKWILRKFALKLDGQLPAQVVSYDRTTNRALVQPVITGLQMNGVTVQRATIASVPVLALGGGGFFINFPLEPGDLGWIEASDRDISRFMQSMAIDAPNTGRIHSFEDGRFVPDVFKKWGFTPKAGAMVISSLDGTVRMEMSSSSIDMYAPAVTINATEMTTVNSPEIVLNGQVTQGAPSEGGPAYTATLQGPVTVVNDLTAAGVSVSKHTHLENGEGNQTDAPTI